MHDIFDDSKKNVLNKNIIENAVAIFFVIPELSYKTLYTQ